MTDADNELHHFDRRMVWAGFRQLAPISIFVTLFGAAFGLAAVQTGLDDSVILAMSVLFALAGALSLDNLVNLNVQERAYEIAAIRAMGGDWRTLLRLVGGEALLATLLSGLLAALAAWPLSWLLCRGVGLLLINHPLTYGYSWAGAGAWLLLSAGFGVFSSFLPLRRMAAAPVRAGLAQR